MSFIEFIAFQTQPKQCILTKYFSLLHLYCICSYVRFFDFEKQAKASDAYESALKRSHVVKIDQINSPKASHADQEVTESFERFELLRFGLVRYYNQLERRKNFELIEGTFKY